MSTILSYLSVSTVVAALGGGAVVALYNKVKGVFTSAETKLANLKDQVAKLEADIAGKL